MQITPEAISIGWQTKAITASGFEALVSRSWPSEPRITMQTDAKTPIMANYFDVCSRSPSKKYANKQTKSGVSEHTIPTVLTLKNLMLRNVMNREMAPCRQRKTRLAKLDLSTLSIKVVFKLPVDA